jgi:hypothetical protein
VCADPGKRDATLGVGGPGPPERGSEWQLDPRCKMTEDTEDGSVTASRGSYAQSECCVHCTNE